MNNLQYFNKRYFTSIPYPQGDRLIVVNSLLFRTHGPFDAQVIYNMNDLCEYITEYEIHKFDDTTMFTKSPGDYTISYIMSACGFGTNIKTHIRVNRHQFNIKREIGI